MLRDIVEVLFETVRLLTFQPKNEKSLEERKNRESRSRKSDFCA